MELPATIGFNPNTVYENHVRPLIGINADDLEPVILLVGMLGEEQLNSAPLPSEDVFVDGNAMVRVNAMMQYMMPRFKQQGDTNHCIVVIARVKTRAFEAEGTTPENAMIAAKMMVDAGFERGELQERILVTVNRPEGVFMGLLPIENGVIVYAPMIDDMGQMRSGLNGADEESLCQCPGCTAERELAAKPRTLH